MAILIGIAVGLILGLTGAGGSVLAVPLLMWSLGWSMPQAAPVALLAVASAASLGTYVAWRKNYVRYRAAILMALVGAVTAPLGFSVADHMPPAGLSIGFAGLLVFVAFRMFIQAQQHPEDAIVIRATVAGDGTRAAGRLCRLNPQTGRIKWNCPCALAIARIGAATGFLSALLGVGGGFVIVPSLRAVTELSMHSAVATSLMAIALTSLGTVAWALVLGRELPWTVGLPFVVGALIGMVGGRLVAPGISGPKLQQGFAILMVTVAVTMFVGVLG